MGMDLSVSGIIPADDDYRKKLAAYHACEEAGVPIPKELETFFKDGPPDEKGMEVYAFDTDPISKQFKAAVESCKSEWGYDIDLSKLPKEIKILRFTAG